MVFGSRIVRFVIVRSVFRRGVGLLEGAAAPGSAGVPPVTGRQPVDKPNQNKCGRDARAPGGCRPYFPLLRAGYRPWPEGSSSSVLQ